ncbi:MAG: aminodeoxychorismate/anthranilate synthase component II [Gammaproteobacteria bacterium]|nr:aminodeoxychorismate/anthranilate synthase component II [Gammaproteobacteria bacterium]
MLLLIDNYDSFTYNVAQYFQQLGQQVEVYRNDEISLEQIEQLAPQYLVISPGPCAPDSAGISLAAIAHFAGKIPMLGICLGHQAIAQAFGGDVVRANKVMHGKTSLIEHQNVGVFKQLANPLRVTRYHSLVVEPSTLPKCFEVTASLKTEFGIEIMAMRHKTLALESVQFHPESVMTEQGLDLLNNFLLQYS